MVRNVAVTILLSVLLTACLDEEFHSKPFFTVKTRTPRFEENGRAVLEGLLENIDQAEVEMYRPDVEIGFLLSAENPEPSLENLNGVEKLLIEEWKSNEDFVHQEDGLSIQRRYFVRAFARIGERVQYGGIEPLSLSDEVQIFISTNTSIKNNAAEVSAIISGLAGLKLVAEDHGFVFSKTEEKPEAGVGDTESKSLYATNKDGFFRDTIGGLEFNTRYFVRAFLTIKGEVLHSESAIEIEILDGWQPIQGLESRRPDGLREAANWVLDDFGYLGLGCPELCEFQNREKQIWKFDPSRADQTEAWSEHSIFNFPRAGAVTFNIGSKLYAGLGTNNKDKDELAYYSDLWVFDTDNPAAGWTITEPFIGDARAEAVAFVIDDTAYVGTGVNTRLREQDATSGAFFSDFYAFHPDIGWRAVDPLPIRQGPGNDCGLGNGRERAIAFAINGRGYVGTGNSRCGILNDLWVFDPSAEAGNQWTYLTETPGEARKGAVGFAIETQQKGYMGTGFYLDNLFLTDFWVFHPDGDGEMGYWTPMTDFQGQGRMEAVGFSIGNKGYVGFGFGANFSNLGVDYIVFSDFWEFIPRENF